MMYLVVMKDELPVSVADAIRRIREDNRRGAVDLCRDAAGLLLRFAKESRVESPEHMFRMVALIGRELIQAQPAMAPMVNLANDVLLAVDRAPRTKSMEDMVVFSCNEYLGNLSRLESLVRDQLGPLLPPESVIMTHSFSRTVLGSLVGNVRKGKSIHLLCTESRPMREGVDLARQFAQRGGRATVIPDAAVYSEMPGVDLVVIGADAVSTRGVVNKTGSSLLALAAREHAVPCYVLAGFEKFLPWEYTAPPQAMRPASELVPKPIDGVAVVNRYFEPVPLPLVTGVVTGTGVLKGEGLLRRLRERSLHPLLRG